MSINASKDLIDLIDSRITAKKYQRVAVVESVSEDNKTAIVRFPETDTTFEFYNKTGEVLAEKDSVYIASNDGDLMNGYIQNRFGESSWLKVGKELEIDPGTIGEDELADGAVTGDKIADFSVTNAHIANLSVDNAKIQRASIDTAKIRDATITTAKIQDASITNAKIENLAVDNAKIAIAAIDTANIKDLAVKRACIDVEAVGTSQIADGSITDAKIVSLTAEKIVTGIIDTSKVTVLGANGKLRIANNRLQVFDNQTEPIERVSLGDVNGDGTVYGFRVRGADGATTLIDETGVKAEGITDGSISNAKISGTAEIEGTKLLDNSIPGGKIVIDGVTAREIAAKTITANEILANTITAGEIAAGAITADEIAAEAVTAAKIKAGEITTSHVNSAFGQSLNLSSNTSITITAAQISLAGAVTFSNLSTSGQTTINGENITTGTISASRLNLSGYATFTSLSTAGSTTINGSNITTGTISASRINLSGALNGYSSGLPTGFTVTSTGLITIPNSANIKFDTSGYASIGMDGTTYIKFYNQNGGGFKFVGGDVTVQDDLIVSSGYTFTAPNIPTTSTVSTEKISKMHWKNSTYVNVTLASGSEKGITVWDSDKKWKTNINDSQVNALATIQKIKPRSFNWIETGIYEDCGFIAQEIEEAIGGKHVLKVSQENGDVNYQLLEKGFIPLLTKGVQELNTKTNEFTAKLQNEISILQLTCVSQQEEINQLKADIELIKSMIA